MEVLHEPRPVSSDLQPPSQTPSWSWSQVIMDNYRTERMAGQKKEVAGRLTELLMRPKLWLGAAAQVSAAQWDAGLSCMGLGSGIYTKLSQDFL